MPTPSIIEGDFVFNGNVAVVTGFVPPDGSITNAKLPAAAGIASAKVIHRFSESIELYGPTTTIAALTKLLRIARRGGTLVSLQAATTVQASGDRSVTVDLQKSTGGGAFATVLSSPLSIPQATAVRTAQTATIASPTFVAGDIFQLVVALGGSSGTYPQGLIVTVDVDQDPNT